MNTKIIMFSVLTESNGNGWPRLAAAHVRRAPVVRQDCSLSKRDLSHSQQQRLRFLQTQVAAEKLPTRQGLAFTTALYKDPSHIPRFKKDCLVLLFRGLLKELKLN